jgi:hypothetical protein
MILCDGGVSGVDQEIQSGYRLHQSRACAVARLFVGDGQSRRRSWRTFAGGQESVAAGASAGGNDLFGGRNNEIVPESVSIAQKDAGLTFADGVAEMSFTAAL